MAVGSWQERVLFITQLRSLMDTGITLDTALPLAGGRRGPYREAAELWARAVSAGQPLSEQMQRSGEPALVCALVRAGELSGHLPAMCREIEAFYSHCLMLKRLVIGRSIYPLILIHLALMMPPLVGFITGSHGAWLILLGPALLWTLALGLLLLGHLGGRSGWNARLCATLPGLRTLTRQLVCANSCLVLRAGASAGMLYHNALEMAASACGNRWWGQRLERQANALMHGDCPQLSQALEDCDFPADLVQILRSAEIGGAVERALGQMATISRERFTSALTWTMRVAVGVLMALAMLIAIIAIFSIFSRVYLTPLQDAMNY
ncbi:MAG: hypothetical protein EA402_10030 [Planctomycetota bacterium]|nr:MAG: hypothetical protein EA402_10030 [Planctomycetota bacterium]